MEPISPMAASITELYPVDLPSGRERAATIPSAGTQPGPTAAMMKPIRYIMIGATATWPPDSRRNFFAISSSVPLPVATVQSRDTPSSITKVLALNPAMVVESSCPMATPRTAAASMAIRPTFFFRTNPIAITAIKTISAINANVLFTKNSPPLSLGSALAKAEPVTFGMINSFERSV